MSAVELPRSRPLTYDDLQAMPDDGRRYELIDGVLLVSPSPRPIHQRVVTNLALQLGPLTPPEWEMLVAPLDVKLADDTVLEPDVLIGRMTDFTPQFLGAAPVLAVEVLSPSTRNVDLTLKKDRLRQFGCAHYWVADPDEPSVIAWDLVDGEYVEAGRATGEESLALTAPFPVTVTPQRLIER